MSLKHRAILCFTLLFFNYVTASNNNLIIERPDDLEDISENVDNLDTKDDGLLKLKNNVITLLEMITGDLINKEKKNSPDVKKALDKIYNKLDALETTLDKHTEDLANISAKIIPSSEETDQGLSDENNASKLEQELIEQNKKYNEGVFKNKHIKLDDLDKSVINKTGCKYLTLKKDIPRYFTVDDKSVDFETYFAVRSSENMNILLWDHKSNLNVLDHDYEIGLGVPDNFNEPTTSLKIKNDTVWHSPAVYIMSQNYYEKFYIKTYNDTLEFGISCDKLPLHTQQVKFEGKLLSISFLSRAKNGAGVIFDCPASTCADHLEAQQI